MQKLAQLLGAPSTTGARCEARLNAFPHFITEIDGLDIHFIHVRSKHENALPLIITHGWPGSIIEQLKVIEPLTNPTAHGGTRGGRLRRGDSVAAGLRLLRQADDARLGPRHASPARGTTLMKRLGYTRYVAQGGDWGNAVSEVMALQPPPELLGISTNMAATVPPEIEQGAVGRRPAAGQALGRRAQRVGPARLLLQERAGLRATRWAHRPQTLYGTRGFADRPRGLDARPRRAQLRADRARLRRAAGRPDAGRHSRQRHALLADEHRGLLGAALLGHHAELDGRRLLRRPRDVKIPVAVSAFPDEIYTAPQSWAGAGVSQADPLQQAPQGRPLRGVGAAGVVRREMRAGFRSLR